MSADTEDAGGDSESSIAALADIMIDSFSPTPADSAGTALIFLRDA